MPIRDKIKEGHLYTVDPFFFKEEWADIKDKIFVPMKIDDGGVAFILLTSQRTIPEEFEKDHGIYSYSELGRYGDKMFENHSLYFRQGMVLTDNGAKAGFFCMKDSTVDTRTIHYYSWDEMNRMDRSLVTDYGKLLPSIRNDVDNYLSLVRNAPNMSVRYNVRREMSAFYRSMDGLNEDHEMEQDISDNRLSNMDRQRLSGLGMSRMDIDRLQRMGSFTLDGFFYRRREEYDAAAPLRIEAKMLLKLRNGVLLAGDVDGRRLLTLQSLLNNEGTMRNLVKPPRPAAKPQVGVSEHNGLHK